MRQPDHDPGAVAGRGVGAGRAAVLEPVEGDEGAVDRLVDRPAVEATDERDAATVVEAGGVVDAPESTLLGVRDAVSEFGHLAEGGTEGGGKVARRSAGDPGRRALSGPKMVRQTLP